MLLSKMPWYTVQNSSQVPCIKFLKEEWHFENKPTVVLINQQRNLENKNALHLTRRRGMMAFPSTRRVQTPYALHINPPGPHEIKEYTFLCGGKDKTWIKRFSDIVNAVAEDPVIQKASIFIEFSHVEKSRKRKRTPGPWNQELTNLLLSYENESKWAVLTKGPTRVVIDNGMTILNVLEEFEEWKENVHKRGFEICFKEHHDKLLQTRRRPWTS